MSPEQLEELDQLAQMLSFPTEQEAGPARVFRTFQEAKDFFTKEIHFWNSLGSLGVGAHYQQILSILDQAASQPNLNAAKQALVPAINKIRQNPRVFIRSDSPFAEYIAALSKKSQEVAKAAISYYDGTWTQRTFPGNNPAFLEGTIAAIMFKHNFFDAAVDARLQTVDRVITAMSETGVRFRSDREQFNADATALIDNTQASITKTLGNGQQAISNAVEVGTTEFSKTTSEWIEKFTTTHESADKDLVAIKAAYDEQMKLRKPAEYWEELEDSYNQRGFRWMWASVVAAVLFVAAVAAVVYFPPLMFSDTEPTLGGIKGAVTLAAGISMFVYLISIFVKLSTSSYHLARDARERYQLTHVFLALIKEQAIESKDRELILAALFSRADTGLLKGDSGPTIPTLSGSLLDAIRGGRGS